MPFTYNNFTDKFGHSNSSAFMKISSFNLFDPEDKLVIMIVCIYKSESDYDNNKEPIEMIQSTVRDTDFDTYFAESVLDDAGKTLLSQSEEWLKTQTVCDGVNVSDWTQI